ncbi:MAG: DUF2905 domain-containing protein [candidate division Zixibacteria bacterium HGW-Zixibacteria-1]|nr:MAG: DUF2905 domain-containing protein [candidate division Zixibacteria bacterium HGW-Zixibacteria-1]
MPVNQLGKLLVIFGAMVILAGSILLFYDRIPFLGKLPGDLHFKKGNMHIYFPIVTSLVLSVILTIILNLFGRGK